MILENEPMGPGWFIFFRAESDINDTDAGLSGGRGAGKRRRKQIEEENKKVMEIIKDGFPEMIKKIIE